VVLSALNRAVDEIKFGRARMKDYKDCGALEADADVIMSLFKIRKLQEQEGDLIGVDVLKQRAGPTGSVALNFWKPVMQWGSTDYVVEDLLESGSKALRKEL
jgi:replicative DNA helicase